MKAISALLALLTGAIAFSADAASPCVISINYADADKRAVMNDADCAGELVAVGKAAGWNNIRAQGTNENLVVWNGLEATVDAALTVETKGTEGPRQPNTNQTYPSIFQRSHVRGAAITVRNIPFARYDVYLYYSARQYNSYGYFGTAKVNGTDWAYTYTGDGTTDVGYMEKADKVWTNYKIDGTYVYSLAEAPQLGHNVLIVKGETSPTLTLAKSTKGYFDIAAFQIVENPIPEFAPAGDTTVSAVNAAAVAGDDMLKVTLAGGATLTIDAALSDGLGKVLLASEGAVRLVASGVTDEQLAAAIAKLDVSQVQGGVTCGWGKRVISVNIAHAGESKTIMSGDGADGSLACVGIPSSSWKNIYSNDEEKETGLTLWNGVTATASSLDDAAVDYTGSGSFYGVGDLYPRTFQKYHLESAKITTTGIPFLRYDVILYYSVSYSGSYGYFAAANVNGTDWTWDGEKMTKGNTGKWNDPDNHKAAPQIGLNALRIDGETSSTLTLRSSGTGGNFHIAGYQIVERPIPAFTPSGSTTVSAINAAAVAGDDMLMVTLAAGATLTIDAALSASLAKVVLVSAGAVRLRATASVTDAQRAAVLAALDVAGVAGGVKPEWGRVLSFNYADADARAVMNDADCAGELVVVGKAAGWNNIRAQGTNENLVVWNGLEATVDAALTVETKGDAGPREPNKDRTYPSIFQRSHVRGAAITVRNIPFARYDVYLYYSARYFTTYGYFGTAKVNGTDWAYTYTGDGTTDVGCMEKADKVWTNYEIDETYVYSLAEAPKLGHNVLIVRGETSPTLTLAKGKKGFFDIAAVQIVEAAAPKAGLIICVQ